VKTRRIGGAEVAEIGLGCMNLSHAYGVPPDPAQAARVVSRALELGVTHFDSAALYGFGRNETLLGELLSHARGRIHLASKCGMTGVDGKRVIDGRPATLKRTLEESLTRLRTDVIDLYYLHRWDKSVPIEDSIGALADMVAAGKIRAIGLSEVSAATLRRAHAIHPIAAVQSEYSLWSRNVEIAVLDECRRIGAAFVAFGPVARGFLAGAIADPATFVAGDIRRAMPRFQDPAWSANLQLLPRYRDLAAAARCTPAQLALAWLLHKAPHIIPVPGTTSVAHLEENVAAADVRLDPGLIARLEALINQGTVTGARYPAATQLEIDTEVFPG
jgi:aryl-alcohol dehydrogenase-like predicted oxidoreductase